MEERALGVFWDVKCDSFGYKAKEMKGPMTKRGILSMLSSIYDPLGLASPFILRARRIVQDLFRDKLGWDDHISDEYIGRWEAWVSDLMEMTKVRIPRCIQPREALRSQLHHFCDASELAYGAASYLRVEYSDGSVSSTLVMAKSKLAPIKPLTIPRLELCGATLAARLDGMLRRELEFPLGPSHFWTDSTIVLQYLRNEERRYHTYVANRVAEIHSETEVAKWYHVPTDLNPADDASRGVEAGALGRGRWLNGPDFLVQPQESWPSLDILPPLSKEDPEVRTPKSQGKPTARSTGFAAITKEDKSPDSDPLAFLMARNSSWTRLRRVTAWLLLCKDRWSHEVLT